MRLMAESTLPEVVERYLRAVQADNHTVARPATPGQKPARPTAGIQINHYPGSPLLAAQALREQDRMAFCELQPEEAEALKRLFARDSRVRVHAGDGYEAIRAFVPPRAGETKIGRGLVLIDPPYEAQEAEYPQVIHSVRETLARWPQAICMVWYPIKLRRSLQPFMRKAATLPAKSVLVAEPAGAPGRLAAAPDRQRAADRQCAMAVRPGAGTRAAGAEAAPGRGRCLDPAGVAAPGRLSCLYRAPARAGERGCILTTGSRYRSVQ